MVSSFEYKGNAFSVACTGILLVRKGIVVNQEQYAFTGLCAKRTDDAIMVNKNRFNETEGWTMLYPDNNLSDVEIAMMLIDEYKVY